MIPEKAYCTASPRKEGCVKDEDMKDEDLFYLPKKKRKDETEDGILFYLLTIVIAIGFAVWFHSI